MLGIAASLSSGELQLLADCGHTSVKLTPHIYTDKIIQNGLSKPKAMTGRFVMKFSGNFEMRLGGNFDANTHAAYIANFAML